MCCAHIAAQAEQDTHVFLSWYRFREGIACAAGHSAVGHRAAQVFCHETAKDRQTYPTCYSRDLLHRQQLKGLPELKKQQRRWE